MAKISIVGMDVFLGNLSKMTKEIRNINKGALGEGAKVAAESMRDALENLPIRPNKYTGRQHSERLYGVTESEYAQILNNFGIARFKDSGGAWNTSIGFKGYVHTPSAKFNDQVPTGLLVQAVEYGTEFRKPLHMIANAVKNVQESVAEHVQEYIDEQTSKIMNQ